MLNTVESSATQVPLDEMTSPEQVQAARAHLNALWGKIERGTFFGRLVGDTSGLPLWEDDIRYGVRERTILHELQLIFDPDNIVEAADKIEQVIAGLPLPPHRREGNVLYWQVDLGPESTGQLASKLKHALSAECLIHPSYVAAGKYYRRAQIEAWADAKWRTPLLHAIRERAGGKRPYALDAALGYAARGWKVFPVPPGTKKSHKSAERSDGANWGMTSEPEQIKRDFVQWPNAGIGIPTGEENGIFDLEADTPAGHGVDGLASIAALEAEHGKLPDTLMAVSPSGSVHRIYRRPDGVWIKNSAGEIAPGVDIKGDGGMFVAPPTKRGKGSYRWLNDLPIADAPAWLLELVKGKEPARKSDAEKQFNPYTCINPEPIGKIRRALAAIPNTNEIGRSLWFDIGQSVHAGTGGSGEGLAVWLAWSRRWPRWNDESEAKTIAAWESMQPHSITVATLYALADETSGKGWRSEWDNDIPESTEAEEAPADKSDSVAKERVAKPGKNDWHASDLFDPWAQYYLPKFPLDVLPPQVQEFVVAQGEVIGCSVSAMAMSALATFSGALSHEFSLKLMRHGNWYASPRLWVLLYGDPSYKKTPIFDAATKPLEAHQAKVQEQYRFNLRTAEASGGDKPSEPERYVIYDITPEKMGELLARSPRGLLAKHDELSGWLGHMERYGGKSGQSAKAFWLKAFDGGPHVHDRIARGSIFIQNISSSLLAGIQPKKLAELGNLTADGLLQRFLPYVMSEQRFARDCPCNTQWYDALVQELLLAPSQALSLSDPALEVLNALRAHLFGLELITGGLAEGFQSFVGKLHGIAGSLMLILHKIAEPNGGTIVEKTTVEDVQRLVVDFILPHAMAFYHCAENATNGDRLRKVASFILTSGKQRIVVSDLTSNIADFRGLSVSEVNERVSPLVATDWLRPEGRGIENRAWAVNPNVHAQFAARAKNEETRKVELAKLMHAPRKDKV